MQTANQNAINDLTNKIGAEALKRMSDWEIIARASVTAFQKLKNRMQLDKMIHSYAKDFASAIDGDIFDNDKIDHAIKSSQIMTDLHEYANRVATYRLEATKDVKEIRSGDFDTVPYEEKGMTNIEEMKELRLTAALNAHKKKARIFEREFIALSRRYDSVVTNGWNVLGFE
jgi:hypothetical protein